LLAPVVSGLASPVLREQFFAIGFGSLSVSVAKFVTPHPMRCRCFNRDKNKPIGFCAVQIMDALEVVPIARNRLRKLTFRSVVAGFNVRDNATGSPIDFRSAFYAKAFPSVLGFRFTNGPKDCRRRFAFRNLPTKVID
jgi:hypothetical protein